jgi:alkylated DNA nucleotide flippase Atl1
MASSALEKLRKPQEPKIERLTEAMANWGPIGARMVVSTPAEVDGLIRKIPKGKLASVNTLRDALAKRHGADIACPITTGIFAGISAKAAAEEEEMGIKRTAPWWRVIKSDGKLNEKFPGGVAEHKRRLSAEGFSFKRVGAKNWRVAGWEGKLARLT